MKKYIYGIDLAFDQTGIAIFDEETMELVHLTSVSTLPTKKNGLKDNPNHKNPNMIIGIRLNYLYENLQNLRSLYSPSKIIIERGFSQFAGATQKVFRVHGIINLVFHDVENIYLPPKTVKNIIFNHGKATKMDLANLITERLGYKFSNEDESDAVATGLSYFIKEKKLDWETNTKPPTETKKKKKKKDE